MEVLYALVVIGCTMGWLSRRQQRKRKQQEAQALEETVIALHQERASVSESHPRYLALSNRIAFLKRRF